MMMWTRPSSVSAQTRAQHGFLEIPTPLARQFQRSREGERGTTDNRVSILLVTVPHRGLESDSQPSCSRSVAPGPPRRNARASDPIPATPPRPGRFAITSAMRVSDVADHPTQRARCRSRRATSVGSVPHGLPSKLPATLRAQDKAETALDFLLPRRCFNPRA